MNFVEYCIANKNYSAIKAIKDYSEVRNFSGLSTKQKVGLAAILGAGSGAAVGMNWDKINDYLSNYKGNDDEDDDMSALID